MIQRGLWRERASAQGEKFSDFGQFAAATLPSGLGVRTRSAFLPLRAMLLDGPYYAEYTDCLQRFMLAAGRPRRILAKGEDFRRFWRISTSATSIERMLLTLKRDHPEQFSRVCALELSPRHACIAAGVLTASDTHNRLRFGACDMEAAARLNPRAQADLACELWEMLSVNAQCTFVSRSIEPTLGPGLAQRWRETRSAET